MRKARLTMDLKAIQTAYKRYAAFYDYTFGKLLAPGRRLAVELINAKAGPHANVLEVGVGTGLSLLNYRKDLKITGIDVSREMLDKAHLRLQEHNELDCTLLEMDAEKLDFPNNSFNYVVAMYVASVVPNLANFLAEITRVCIPNGDILILNHFSSEHALVNKTERLLTPLQKHLGFRPDFPVEPIINYPHFNLVESHKTNLLGYWKLLHLKNVKDNL
jgi:phosphatidylethanolamine/phosphatidyl-N-methylethanolamine N-methyltransferase